MDKNKNSRHTVFTVISLTLLLFYLFSYIYIMESVWIYWYDLYTEVATILDLILHGVYLISASLFILYLNKYKSDKWIILSLAVVFSISILSFVFDLEYLLRSFSYYSIFNIIISLFFIFGIVLSIVNVIKDYKYNVLNTTILIVFCIFCLILSIMNFIPFSLLYFSLMMIAGIIQILYINLGKKGPKGFEPFVDPYLELIKAKKLLEEGFIDEYDFEIIREKHLKDI